MPWFKVDDQLHSHPKTRRSGLEAMGLWVAAGSYSMSYKTDGFVPKWFVFGWKNGKKLAQILSESGYWEAHTKDGEEGWIFHDWEDYQPMSDEIEADREAARIRQAERRKRLRGGRTTSDSHEDVTSNVTPPVTRDTPCDVQRESQHPVPSRPVPTNKDSRADALISDFDSWYSTYPKKVGRPAALTKYKTARKKTDADTLLAGARLTAAAYATDKTYCPNPATWLHQERWNDEQQEARATEQRVEPVPAYEPVPLPESVPWAS